MWGIERRALKSAGRPAGLVVVVVLGALYAYLPTLAPTITWRNGGSDSGDLATAVAVLGIPHPPGYPAYVLLGRAWTLLPLGGDVAFRLNVLSAACAALAAALVAVCGWRVAARGGAGAAASLIGGATAGLALALSPLVWSQATVAEVYTPGLAWLGLLTYLVLAWREKRSRTWLLATAGLVWGSGCGLLPQITVALPGVLILALGTGNHVSADCSALRSSRPAAVPAEVAPEEKEKRERGPSRRFASCPLSRNDWGEGLAATGGAAAGLLVFAYLPLRAIAQPAVNWGDPRTWGQFWSLVSAQPYHPYFLRGLDVGTWSARLAQSVVHSAVELGWPVAALALVGGIWLWHRDRALVLYAAYLFVAAVLLRASYPVDNDFVYLMPGLAGMALLAGPGAAWLLSEVPAQLGALDGGGPRPNAARRVAMPPPRWGSALAEGSVACVMVLAVLWPVPAYRRELDASHDDSALRYARSTLNGLPSRALVVSDYDESTFSLWYAQALGQRRDVVVVDSRLLFFDWYQDNLAQRYPDLYLPAVRPGGITALGRPVFVAAWRPPSSLAGEPFTAFGDGTSRPSFEAKGPALNEVKEGP
jgi:hypothetical protein